MTDPNIESCGNCHDMTLLWGRNVLVSCDNKTVPFGEGCLLHRDRETNVESADESAKDVA